MGNTKKRNVISLKDFHFAVTSSDHVLYIHLIMQSCEMWRRLRDFCHPSESFLLLDDYFKDAFLKDTVVVRRRCGYNYLTEISVHHT